MYFSKSNLTNYTAVWCEPLSPLKVTVNRQRHLSEVSLMTGRVFVIVEAFRSDLHLFELRQAFERSGGLQHGEVVVVETPATVTEQRADMRRTQHKHH